MTDISIKTEISGGRRSVWRTPLDFVILVDCSGSMSGKPSRVTAEALQSLVSRDGLLEGFDHVSILLFDEKLTWVSKRVEKKAFSMEYVMTHHGDGEGGFKCGSRTAMYDAIAEGLRFIHGRPSVPGKKGVYPWPYMVVLTDGMDNSSTCDRTKAVSMVASPKENGLRGAAMANLRVAFLTVGDDASKTVDEFTKAGHVFKFEADNAEGIQSTFKRLERHLQETAQLITVQIGNNTATLTVPCSASRGRGRGGRPQGAARGGGGRGRGGPSHGAARGGGGRGRGGPSHGAARGGGGRGRGGPSRGAARGGGGRGRGRGRGKD